MKKYGKKQGTRTDITSAQNARKLDAGTVDAFEKETAKKQGVHPATVRRQLATVDTLKDKGIAVGELAKTSLDTPRDIKALAALAKTDASADGTREQT